MKTLSDTDRGAPEIALKASRTLRRLLALFTSVLGAIGGGAASAQDAQTHFLKGQVVVSRISNIRIHTYVSPQDGWLVNTQIVEDPEKLVIFDAQLLNPYAAEVAAYAASLGKPVDRIIVTHGHRDHWAEDAASPVASEVRGADHRSAIGITVRRRSQAFRPLSGRAVMATQGGDIVCHATVESGLYCQ